MKHLFPRAKKGFHDVRNLKRLKPRNEVENCELIWAAWHHKDYFLGNGSAVSYRTRLAKLNWGYKVTKCSSCGIIFTFWHDSY